MNSVLHREVACFAAVNRECAGTQVNVAVRGRIGIAFVQTLSVIHPRTSKASVASATARAATGVLLLCTGKRGDLVRNCIRSLRESNPALPFHLLADRPYDLPFQWVKSWTGKASRRIKTQLHKYTPYDVTLFADDDTVFAKPIDLRAMLGESDMAFALDVLPTLEQANCMVKWPHHVSIRRMANHIRLLTTLDCGRRRYRREKCFRRISKFI